MFVLSNFGKAGQDADPVTLSLAMTGQDTPLPGECHCVVDVTILSAPLRLCCCPAQ